MKLFRFNYDDAQASWMFAPVRNRLDSLRLLVNAVKMMLVYHPPDPGRVAGEMVLAVSKMSRLFFLSKDKIVSIAFPISVEPSDAGSLTFRTPHCPEVDNRVTSQLSALLVSDDLFTCGHVLDFAGLIDEESGEYKDVWPLVRHLLSAEDGYLRYDHDPTNQDGQRHPLHHLDVFYSPPATFKLGLATAVTEQELRDALDINTDCHFLSPASGLALLTRLFRLPRK